MTKSLEALIADMKTAALRATKGPWRRTSTVFNGITHGKFSLTKEDVLGHFSEKCNAEFVAECDPENVLALIAALEQKDKRTAELESRQLSVKLPEVTTDRQNWTTWDWITHLGGRFQNGEPGDYIEFGSVYAVEMMMKQFKRSIIAMTLSEVKEAIRAAGFIIEGGE